MNEQQRKTLKEKLVQQRDELRTLLDRFAKKDAHVRNDFHSRFPDFGSDDEENADEVAAFQDELSIEHDLESALQETDNALDAMTRGTYGTCRVCHKEIEYERLDVIPSTTLCLEHKATK